MENTNDKTKTTGNSYKDRLNELEQLVLRLENRVIVLEKQVDSITKKTYYPGPVG